MRIDSLNTIFPSFVLQGFANEMSPAENAELSALAWETWKANEKTETAYSAGESGEYYSATRHNMLVLFRDKPVVKKFAILADMMARAYLKTVYHYDCRDPIDMMAEPFCQNRETGTDGIMPHAHTLKPLLVTYYPSVKTSKRTVAGPTSSGVNGETNFYDPSNTGKRVWPNQNPSFHIGSSFRVKAEEGTILAFEGHIPHDSAQFDGDERVCIPVICYPKLPNKNLGTTLDKIL